MADPFSTIMGKLSKMLVSKRVNVTFIIIISLNAAEHRQLQQAPKHPVLDGGVALNFGPKHYAG